MTDELGDLSLCLMSLFCFIVVAGLQIESYGRNAQVGMQEAKAMIEAIIVSLRDGDDYSMDTLCVDGYSVSNSV
jgi:hypothetical protein